MELHPNSAPMTLACKLGVTAVPMLRLSYDSYHSNTETHARACERIKHSTCGGMMLKTTENRARKAVGVIMEVTSRGTVVTRQSGGGTATQATTQGEK